MKSKLLQQLQEEGIIDSIPIAEIEEEERLRLFSVHWQLKTLLYLGVSLFTAGLGIYIYQNIDSIGHLTIVSVIGLTSVACFFYAFRKIPVFSREKVASAGVWQDYI